jgi:Mg2+/citrate symporter
MRAVSEPVAFWCHIMVFIAVVQLPVYGWLPAPMAIIMVGIGLAAREQRLDRADLYRQRARITAHRAPAVQG